MAFLPQFLDTGRPLLNQMMIFETTFLLLAIINATTCALMASAARQSIRKPKVQAIINRTGGSLLIGAGLLTAAFKCAGA